MRLFSTSLWWFFSALSVLLSAQTTIVTGTVRDAKTKEELSMSTLRFAGQSTGVLADISGKFRIESNAPNADTLVCSYLGYAPSIVVVERGKTQQIEVFLEPALNELQTATVEAKRGRKVPKDTLAIMLWREIVAHKDSNARPRSAYFRYDNYTKIQIDVHQYHYIKNIGPLREHKKLGFLQRYIQKDDYETNLPLLFKETLSEVHERSTPKKRHEVIKLDRFSGFENENYSQNARSQVEDINPYDNVIEFAGKSFISPFSASGNISYRYFLTDSVVRNDTKYFKLEFWGRTPEDLAFAGMAWIQDSTFAIEKIQMDIPKSANINHLHRYRVKQSYKRLPDGTWWKESEDIETAFTIWKRQTKEPLSLAIHKFSQSYEPIYSDSVPDSLFNAKKPTWEKNAYQLADSAWEERRPFPMLHHEVGIFRMVDSIKATGFFKRAFAVGYTLATGYIPFGKVEFGHLFQAVSWNEVEGTRLRFALRTSDKFSRRMRIGSYLAYGTKDERLKYGANFSWNIPNPNNLWQNVRAAYTDDYSIPGSFNRRNYDNIFSSLTRRTPLTKLMRMQTAEVSFSRAWVRGLDNTLALRHRIFHADENTGFEFSDGQQILSKFSVSEVQLNTHWGPGEQFFSNASTRTSLGSKLPVFYLDYTFRHLDNFLGQDLQNHQLDFYIRHRLNWQIGYTRYTLTASKIWGKVPYPLMTTHLGNGSYMYNRNAFNMMNEFELVSDAYLSLILDHHFDGFFLNKLPLIRKMKMREIFIFRSVLGSVDARNLDLMQLPVGASPSGFYAEIGFGIENIFQMLRIDFMWRLTQLDRPTSVPFGIKFAFQPKF